MNRFAGKNRSVLLLLRYGLFLLLSLSLPAMADLFASVDRREIALGETLRLTLTGDAGEQPAEIDLTPLNRDWEILSRSSATNARYINGQNQITRTLEMELAPLREGTLGIPSLSSGGRSTTPLSIRVNPEPVISPGDALVLFEASVDQPAVYVQAELMLTVTLQQAINLDGGEISAFDIPDAVVEPLERRSFQRRLGNRTWLVTELRFAVYPQKSGAIKVPAIGFTAREVQPGRSLLGARLGRRLRMASEPIEVEVKSVPDGFPGAVWLPARSLTLEENWSVEPDGLSVGDSTTRTLTVVADGLQGSQLPPLSSLQGASDIPELKFYPDQEAIDQTELVSGLQGRREQSEALVARASGEWTLPEIRVPWWNTETDTLSYATLPARQVSVRSAATAASALEAVTLSSNTSEDVLVPFWLWGVAGSGWLAAGLLLWLFLRARANAGSAAIEPAAKVSEPSIRQALVRIRQALEQQDPAALRQAVLQWGAGHHGKTFSSLSELASVSSEQLRDLLRDLDRALYSEAAGSTASEALISALREEPALRAKSSRKNASLALYPTG
ncbi:MAG: BatD family protein [Halieaceae bacterium]